MYFLTLVVDLEPESDGLHWSQLGYRPTEYWRPQSHLAFEQLAEKGSRLNHPPKALETALENLSVTKATNECRIRRRE